MRAVLALAIIALVTCPSQVSGQYFGQNRVQYRHLDFAIIGTEHFDIYSYEEERAAALDAARMAERSYQQLSRVLNHRYRERQPLILFASHSEFQQNNVAAIAEGTGGVTEPYRHRILLPFTGSYSDFEHVLTHELVHQFQFDVFSGGNVGGGIPSLMSVAPPLWFMEGMAEYLSLGPIDAQTAMWLRDAAINNRLPDLEALNWDLRANPYRFGHALWSYVGERWGKGVVGDILRSTSASGIDGAFRRALGMSLPALIQEWHVAIKRAYLPDAVNHWYAFQFTEPVLTKERSKGSLHVAPALSPDGERVAYFSEGGSYFIDLYLADVWSGKIEQRLIESAFSSDFESLRFINSAGSWSPDGRWLAIAAKHGGRDDIVVFDMTEGRVNHRIEVPLNGVTNPSWSPEGTHLVFTGYDGGFSDLFIVKADGTGLQRLTHDPYAALHPAWAPDGETIAFATDRGPRTDLAELTMGPMSIATINVRDRHIDILPGMVGNNIDPQWAPDGGSLAFVSDRSGIANIFLYEFADRRTYQLTDVFTGVAGITPLSPAISWARQADRLAFTYYEQGSFNVYRIDDPRALKEDPWGPLSPQATVALVPSEPRSRDTVQQANGFGPAETTFEHGMRMLSRGTQALRLDLPERDPPTPVPTISVKALLDSAAALPPDTTAFSYADYRPKLTPDYIGATSIGYVRDNFGSGFYGGSAISLSDMLSNHRVMASVAINGRVDEAQVFAAYANMSRRINWTAGISMRPYFSYMGNRFVTSVATVERFIFREAFVRAHRPFSRLSRLEIGFKAVNVSHAALDVVQVFDPVTQLYRFESNPVPLGEYSYIQPTVALVFDNAVSLYTGPMFGRRSRLEYSPAFGGRRFHEIRADLRRYDRLGGPLTLASRVFFFGRFGRDTDQFPLYLGNTDLIRGYTAGSIYRHECDISDPTRATNCATLNQLVGSRLALLNLEVRFPLFRQLDLGFAPVTLPPVEGAVFFDAGVAWDSRSSVVVRRDVGVDRTLYRQPLSSVGVAVRANMWGLMVLRLDYTRPLNRAYRSAYVTISIGPTY
jgi:hypothetical protein